jgi:uncharacterized membrane protein YqjE
MAQVVNHAVDKDVDKGVDKDYEATGTTAAAHDDRSVAQLVTQLSDQLSRLAKNELRLAQLELAQKAKGVGIGVGLFGGTGVLAIYGTGALVACAILLLALAVPGWLAALIVAVALFLIAGVLALIGLGQVRKAVPPVPQGALDSVKADVATVKARARR